MTILGCFMSKHSRWTIYMDDLDGVLKADRRPLTPQDVEGAWLPYPDAAMEVSDYTVVYRDGRKCLTRVVSREEGAILTTAWEVYP